MRKADHRPLAAVEPVDIDNLLSSMTEEQREAARNADAALDVAAFVRRIRESKGLDRRVLAEMTGISEQRLSDIESAKLSEAPSVAVLARIAGAVGEELPIELRGKPSVFEHVYTISAIFPPPAIPGSALKGMLRAVLVLLDEKHGYGIIKPDSGGEDVFVQAGAGLRLDNLHAGQRLAVAFDDDKKVRLIVEH